MFADKRRVNRREFLRLGGAGLAGAGLLLGGVGCGGGEGTGENAIGWQAIPSYSPQAPDKKRVDYLNQSISDWEGGVRRVHHRLAHLDSLISSSDVTVAMARLLKQANEDRTPDIAQIDSYVFPRFYEYVYPLDGYLEETGVTDDYFPFIESLMLGDGGVVKGCGTHTTDGGGG